jgi:exodeoxyribonuclease-3
VASGLRILTYNICRGGVGRENRLAAVIARTNPDLVILQEATRPSIVGRLAAAAGFPHHASRAGGSLAFLSRESVSYSWHRPRASRHAFLEIVLPGDACRIFGIHLSAVHSAWTERRRLYELRALLGSVGRHQHGFHVLTGDFNTLAPGERFDFRLLPLRLRSLVWLSGGRVRWRTIERILEAGYLDVFRTLHPNLPGLSFPASKPHVLLDFAFVRESGANRIVSCDVIDGPEVRVASDHLPLLTVVRV